MLENELESIATKLEEFRKSTNTRKKYPKDIKKRIVALLEEGLSVAMISRATGIHGTTLCKWRGPKKHSPFIAPQIIQDQQESGGITLITGLSSDDLLKVLSFIQ